MPARRQGSDGLSGCEPVPGTDNDNDNLEEWIDTSLSLGIWIDNWQPLPRRDCYRVNIVRAPAKQECALTFAVKPAALAQHKSESVTSLLPVLACEVKGRERGWKWIVAGRMEGERGAREPIELEPMVSFAICLAHCLDGMQTHCRDHEMTCQCLLLLRSPSLCEIPCMKGANDYGRR
jgi:hypothetical protein